LNTTFKALQHQHSSDFALFLLWQGTIPPEMGKMKSLSDLDLYFNQISGAVPESFSKLENLSQLYLFQNLLTSVQPASMSSSLKLCNMQNNTIKCPRPQWVEDLCSPDPCS